ncbi:hypothetical protein [Actinomycetospora sp. CA-053990]|uniref:hypothetical protein n=1 Tax=Actinomycetospora sp. CA-053990 TaxID=3239891 RepID=UPI003D8BE380
MQEQGDTALAAAVDATPRYPAVKLEVDWNRTGLYDHPDSVLTSEDRVETVTVERSLTSDLPETASQIDGYASSTLKATIGGRASDGLPLAESLSPYRPTGSMYRKPLPLTEVRCSMGLRSATGTKLLPQFAGQTRDVDFAETSPKISISALDPADRLRASITLPAYAIDRRYEARNLDGYSKLYGYTALEYFTGRVNTQWFVDYILRRNDIWATPRVRQDLLISVTGNGGFPAETGITGLLQGSTTSRPDYTAETGPFGETLQEGNWLTYNDGSLVVPYYTTEQVLLRTGNGIGVSQWLDVQPDAAASPSTRTMWAFKPFAGSGAGARVQGAYDAVNNEFVVSAVGNTTGTVRFPAGAAGWKFVGFHARMTSTTGMTVTMRLGGAISTKSLTFGGWPDQAAPVGTLEAYFPLTWAHLQMWSSPSPESTSSAVPWTGEVHTPEADVPRGANYMYYLPDVVNMDSWKLMQEIMQAENGLVGFDENKEFFYKPRNLTTNIGTIEKTVKLADSVSELSYTVSSDSVRNTITTTTQTAHYPTTATDVMPTVWSTDAPDELVIPVGIWEYEIALPPMTVLPWQDVPQKSTEQWKDTAVNATITSGFVATSASNTAFPAPWNSVYVTVWQNGPRSAILRVRNYWDKPIQMSTWEASGTNPTAAFRLSGLKAELDNPVVKKIQSPGSVARYGERVLELPTSKWRQSQIRIAGIVNGLLALLANPLPILEDIELVGDPRVQLGDTIRLVGRTDKLSIRATVVKLKRVFSRSTGLHDTYAVRPIAPPGYGVIGDSELGRLGSTLAIAS